jgi:hypothetical protein
MRQSVKLVDILFVYLGLELAVRCISLPAQLLIRTCTDRSNNNQPFRTQD